MEHDLDDISQDDEGWWWVACSCSWSEGPFDAKNDAAEAYGDHRENP